MANSGLIFVNDPAPLTRSAIIISKDYLPTDPLNVVLYFHGYRAPPIDVYLSNRGFHQIIDASQKKFVFIAPQLGQKSEFPVSAAGAVDYVKRMLGVLATRGPFTSTPKINQLVLAAHSGGGAAMLSATAWFKGVFPVVEAWALDCLYGMGDPIGAPDPHDHPLYESDSRTTDKIIGYKQDPKTKQNILDPKTNKPIPIFEVKPIEPARNLSEWRYKQDHNSVVEVRKSDGTVEKVPVGTVEKQWFDLSKGGLSVKVFWGNGGTLTRTANLDLLDHLDQTSMNLDLRPEFYTCPTPEQPVLITPRPSPRSQHDPLPQTVLGECIRDCRFL